ncbi:MAG: YkgJ family cysteine cluster protein [Desulfurococcus sp.]|nr:YkgJ family cysteine cluster protein [Desulfurococcus sp.]
MERVISKGDKIKYKCLRSGVCCRSGPNVALTAFDVCRIARFLGVEWRRLIGSYIYAVIADHIPIPVLRGVNGRCVFLEVINGVPSCRIYPARPRRCRLFPFIPLSPSITDRVRVSSICPGIGEGEESEPPWSELERYSEEVKAHYKLLYDYIFTRGYEPLDALEAVIDFVCSQHHSL